MTIIFTIGLINGIFFSLIFNLFSSLIFWKLEQVNLLEQTSLEKVWWDINFLGQVIDACFYDIGDRVEFCRY